MTNQLAKILLLVLTVLPCLALAQKKELSQARTYIKSGRDYDKAEQLMVDLLKKDPANKANEKIYLMWFEAVQHQYAEANERMYLKQNQDTAAFFDLNKRMFVILEMLDSLDMKPDAKGKVSLDYRAKHSELLNGYRPNLFNGGLFYVRKGMWKEAYEYMEMYIDCARQPLFEKYDYATTDKRQPEAAYWATYSAYRMQDAVLTLRHRQLALNDSAKAQFTLQYIAEARHWLKDQELYVKTLETGFHRYPTSAYFFPRLFDVYNQNGQLDKALAISDSALQVNSSSELYLFAKSTTLLRMEQYGESIKVSDRLIQQNDSLAEPYFNAGTAYLNMTLKLDERKDKKQMRTLYQKARPYMERYRQLKPTEKQKWAPALYRIYLNLNMGKQFDEIDRLLNK